VSPTLTDICGTGFPESEQFAVGGEAHQADEWLAIDDTIGISKEVTQMAKPSPYSAAVVVPLPDDAEMTGLLGDAYHPDTALNVMKMMAGTGNMFPALIGMVQAVFQ
jgi:hypothetical protein